MNALVNSTERYLRDGVDLIEKEMQIDLSRPLAVPITGVNELTGEVRKYMLRVTSKGTICIV